MHGVRRQPRRDGVGPHDLRRRRFDLLLGEAAGGIFGGEQLAHPPRRILQGCRDRMPAVEDSGVLGRPQAVAPGALEPLAALDLLVRRAGLCSRSCPDPSAGLSVEMTCGNHPGGCATGRPLTSTGSATINRAIQTGRRATPFVLRDQYGATVWESVPSGKGGGL